MVHFRCFFLTISDVLFVRYHRKNIGTFFLNDNIFFVGTVLTPAMRCRVVHVESHPYWGWFPSIIFNTALHVRDTPSKFQVSRTSGLGCISVRTLIILIEYVN